MMADAGEFVPALDRRPTLLPHQFLLAEAYQRIQADRPLSEHGTAPMPSAPAIGIYFFLELWEIISRADWLELVAEADAVVIEHWKRKADTAT